jgi:hydrogenase nickel incorporation protein HypA/HybF
MHELSIAIRIVDMAESEASKAGAQLVTHLDIDVGTLSGVVLESLDFALKQAVLDSVLENCAITIHRIQAMARCNGCLETFEVRDYFDLCPRCESPDISITQGEELRLRSLKVVTD